MVDSRTFRESCGRRGGFLAEQRRSGPGKAPGIRMPRSPEAVGEPAHFPLAGDGGASAQNNWNSDAFGYAVPHGRAAKHSSVFLRLKIPTPNFLDHQLALCP
jgi:hypothetical protein